MSYEAFLDEFSSPVKDDINDYITQDVTDDEIRSNAFKIGKDRAPGLDRMTYAFYQQLWTTIGEDIMKDIWSFFETSVMPSQLYQMHIFLIPMIEQPSHMSDYHPISLWNVSYKIISKILIRHLKKILPQIISPKQTAFVPGIHITKNLLVAHERLHSLSTRCRQAKSYMVIKTDINKAYDHMD